MKQHQFSRKKVAIGFDSLFTGSQDVSAEIHFKETGIQSTVSQKK